MEHFTPWSSLAGGALIGVAATLLYLLNGRIAGISNIVNGVLQPRAGDTSWRLWFLSGLVLGSTVYLLVMPLPFTPRENFPPVLLIAAGLLVGFGSRLGNGCTSGHGVCGLARLSLRSLVATLTFVSTGMVTVLLVTRHLTGG